jgi:nucleoside-triphosphatase
MKKNLLITGPPGSGKTTVLLKLSDMLRNDGHDVGGIICPEIHVKGTRMGFRIIDVLGGEEGILSHVDLIRKGVPRVSRYGINLGDLDRISRQALSRSVDFFIIDEIGPMELRSKVFISEVERIFNSDIPVAAAVHYRTSWGFAGRVKSRGDTETFIVSEDNRDGLPVILHSSVSQILRRHI